MLSPLPYPGIILFSNWTAKREETYFMKEDESLSSKQSLTISAASAPKNPILHITENEKHTVVFRLPNNQEVMRITKEVHYVSGRAPEYHGFAPDGTELWHLTLKRTYRMLLQTHYHLTIYPDPSNRHDSLALIEVKSKITGADMGVLVNQVPALTINKSESWDGGEKNSSVVVAPGMDILLSLGINWVRYDRDVAGWEDVLELVSEFF